jgi:photosystem II stability/assembly factor-like uncharacterized protein
MKKMLMQFALGIGLMILFTHSAMSEWVECDTFANGSMVSAIIGSSDNIFAGTTGSGIFISTNNGDSWATVNTGLPRYFSSQCEPVYAFAVSGNNIFAGIDGGVFLTSNNGTSWAELNNGVAYPDTTVKVLAVSGNNLYAGSFAFGIYYSANNGTSWNAVNAGIPKFSYNNGYYTESFYLGINAIAVCGSNVFVGTDTGIYRSSINGGSWSAANNGLININRINSFAVTGNNIFVGTQNSGTLLSTDNGDSWSPINDSLFGYDTTITAFAVSGNNVFASTGHMGIFLTTNKGTSWSDISTSLLDSYISSLAVNGDYLFAVTSDKPGVWRRPLSEMIGATNLKPQSVIASREYFKIHSPSHINPNISIEFSLPHSDKVSLKIYSLSGHEIASLVNKNLNAGTHSISWNTRNLAAGCYTVRMQAGANTYVKSIPITR